MKNKTCIAILLSLTLLTTSHATAPLETAFNSTNTAPHSTIQLSKVRPDSPADPLSEQEPFPYRNDISKQYHSNMLTQTYSYGAKLLLVAWTVAKLPLQLKMASSL